MGPTRNREQVLEKLRDFFAREILDGHDEGLAPSTPLLELGIINSLSVVMLASFVDNEFSLQLKLEELSPANLASLATIADLLDRLSSTH
jgi:acyl carrier protein